MWAWLEGNITILQKCLFWEPSTYKRWEPAIMHWSLVREGLHEVPGHLVSFISDKSQHSMLLLKKLFLVFFQLLQALTYSLIVIFYCLQKFPELKFKYVEEEQPEEFFIPYVWSLVYNSAVALYWNPQDIQLFTMDSGWKGASQTQHVHVASPSLAVCIFTWSLLRRTFLLLTNPSIVVRGQLWSQTVVGTLARLYANLYLYICKN